MVCYYGFFEGFKVLLVSIGEDKICVKSKYQIGPWSFWYYQFNMLNFILYFAFMFDILFLPKKITLYLLWSLLFSLWHLVWEWFWPTQIKFEFESFWMLELDF